MKALFKPALAAGFLLAAASPLTALPAAAQSTTIKGLGVVDVAAVVNSTTAFKTAESQRPTTYKPYYDQAQVKAQQVNAQLQPLVDKQRADSQAATPDEAKLNQQAQAIQQLAQQGQNEVDQIMAPVYLSRTYVDEQIEEVLPKALKAAADKRGVSIVLRLNPDSIIYRDQAYDLTQAVADEVNALLPIAQLVPPPGWLPREYRERLAAQQAAQGVQPGTDGAAAPAAQPGTPTEGR